MLSSHDIVLAGERVTLLGDRAFCWPARKTLVITDPHFGKAAAFRSAAIPVPGNPMEDDLARLTELIAETRPERLLCLGDLLHAKTSQTAEVDADFSAWRAEHQALAMVLVRGNHDRFAGDPPASWGIECVKHPIVEKPFVWQHYPHNEGDGRHPDGYVLAGHLHPAVGLRGIGALPCFAFGRYGGILPAFGSFTGTAAVSRKEYGRIFVVAEETVIPLP